MGLLPVITLVVPLVQCFHSEHLSGHLFTGATTSRHLQTRPRRVTASSVTLPTRPRSTDPFDLVKPDMRTLKKRIKSTLERQVGSRSDDDSSAHPMLQQAAKEFFERREKNFRMVVVLLIGRSLIGGKRNMPREGNELLMQLAEITEMMHTATVIHDDILEDHEPSIRGNVAHDMYDSNIGNKVSVLAGDFLLSRSSVQLAALKDTDVVEVMATALENMMEGGVMQVDPLAEQITLQHYINKIHQKTASLIARCCQSAAMLQGHKQDSEIVKAVWAYGYNVGMAYQLMNDLMIHNISELCNVAEQDMTTIRDNELTLRARKCVNAGPFHFAAEDHHAELLQLAEGGLQSDQDVQRIMEIVEAVDGEQKTKDLALSHAQQALSALEILAPTVERHGLELLVHFCVGDGQKDLQRPAFNQKTSKSKMFS